MNRLIIEKTRSASGDIVNIQDGAAGQNIPSLLVDLQPTQDLNGYSNPWPGGGGKNLFNKDDSGILTDRRISTGNGGTYSSTGNSVSNYISVSEGQAYSLTTGRTAYSAFYDSNKTFISGSGGNWGDQAQKTAPAGAAFVRFDFLTDNIGAVQFEKGSATSYAPYSNVCPVNGYTGANIYVGEANEINEANVVLNRRLNASGNAVSSTNGCYFTDFFSVVPGEYYYLSNPGFNPGLTGLYPIIYYNSSQTATGGGHMSMDNKDSIVFGVPSSAAYIRINAPKAQLGTGNLRFLHISSTINATWQDEAGTVYGGYADVVQGLLVATWAKRAITNSTVLSSFTYSAQYGSWARIYLTDAPPDLNVETVNAMSEVAAGVSYNDRVANPDIFRIYTDTGQNSVNIRASAAANISTSDDLKAAFVGTSFIYKLANPIVFQFQGVQVQTLGGINNIFSDAGAISLIYNADEEIEDTLISGNCLLTNAMVGDELSIDELDFTILLSNGLALYDSDHEELLDANGDQLYVQSLGAVKYGTRIDYYIDSDMVGRFYVESVKRIGPSKYAFSCVSAIGLLARMEHLGGIYQGTLAGDIFSDIMGAIPYTIDDVVANTPVYGWLPSGKCRDNLHALMFALGASVTKDSGVLHFLFLDEPITNITDDRVYLEGSVEDITQASLVNVTEHAFVALADDETITLFDNTDGGTAANSVFVSFNEPMHDLSADGLTIEESGVNYAVVSGVGTLTGQVYTHTTSVISKENPEAVYEHVISCDENFLVSAVNSSNVVNRLYNYYVNAQEVEGRLVVGAERPGARLNIKSIYGEYVTGYLKSIDITMSNTIAAQFALAAGWYPGYFGNNYNNVIIASSSGSVTIPAGVTKARLVLIGGGQGGASGLKGEDGEDSTMSDFNEKGEQGDGGAGGAGGAGGHGGKVYDTGEIDVTPGTYTLVVGSGGAGGTYSATQSNQGSEGGDTTLLGYSSANGYVLGSGYLDVINGDRYAVYGEDGIPGGDGGAGSDAYNVLSEAGGDVDIYTGGAGSLGVYKDFSDDTWKVGSGSGGGGAAYGNNGANGNPPTIDAYGIPQVLADGGDGGAATTPTDALAYGQGGRGGHGGGGGGGAGGGAATGGRSFLQGSGGTGGAGSDGENGANGCAFIFY